MGLTCCTLCCIVAGANDLLGPRAVRRSPLSPSQLVGEGTGKFVHAGRSIEIYRKGARGQFSRYSIFTSPTSRQSTKVSLFLRGSQLSEPMHVWMRASVGVSHFYMPHATTVHGAHSAFCKCICMSSVEVSLNTALIYGAWQPFPLH